MRRPPLLASFVRLDSLLSDPMRSAKDALQASTKTKTIGQILPVPFARVERSPTQQKRLCARTALRVKISSWSRRTPRCTTRRKIASFVKLESTISSPGCKSPASTAKRRCNLAQRPAMGVTLEHLKNREAAIALNARSVATLAPEMRKCALIVQKGTTAWK